MTRLGVILTIGAWFWLVGLLEGSVTRSDSPHAVSQQEPAQHFAPEQVVRPGTDGLILLNDPTWLAEQLLKPGRYEFQQRIDHGEPRLRVMEVRRYMHFKRGVRDSKRLLAEVQCRVEPLGEVALGTAVHIRWEAGIARVDWLSIAGQDGRCVPGTVLR